MSDVEALFHKLRHSRHHHIGLGDVRLTLAQQEALAYKFEALRQWIERTGDQHDICTQPILGKACNNCRCGKSET
jgi:hypothetical protein